MEDSELSAAFHAAYDASIPPAPWLGASLRAELDRRRTAPARPMRFRMPGAAMASLVAVLLVAVLLVVVMLAHVLPLGQHVVPGHRSSTACPPAGFPEHPTNEANVQSSGSLAPLPPAASYGCTIWTGSTDSVATLAAFYQSRLAAGGWNVQFAGQTPGFVVTRWVRDAAVTNGPQPGYRPELTGLTGDDVAAASALLDQAGTSWLVDVTLTPRGKALFANLTRANIAACPGSANTFQSTCAGRYLTFWVGLTQADIDRWHESAFVAEVSQTFAGTTAEPGPKLISDPVTLEAIIGGEFEIAVGDRSTADYIADAFNTGELGTHYQIRFSLASASTTFGSIDLVPGAPGTQIFIRVSWT